MKRKLVKYLIDEFYSNPPKRNMGPTKQKPSLLIRLCFLIYKIWSKMVPQTVKVRDLVW